MVYEVIWSRDTPFSSSSAHVDNASDFPTASVFYCAWAGSKPVTTVDHLLADMEGETR